MSKTLIIFTDGGARGNPGPAGIGAVILDEQGKALKLLKRYIGEATNNVAEYQALIMALNGALLLSGENLQINMDSELIVRQMQGRYKIKEPTLIGLAREVVKLTNQFTSVKFSHVPREQNKLADKLVNEAIDNRLTE